MRTRGILQDKTGSIQFLNAFYIDMISEIYRNYSKWYDWSKDWEPLLYSLANLNDLRM